MIKFPTKTAKFVVGFIAGICTTLLLSFYTKTDPPACVISCDKMNGMLIGMDNPVSILARGISMEQLIITVSGAGITLEKVQDYRFIARVTTPGVAEITISDGDKFTQSFRFFVKRLPDPEIVLGARFHSGTITCGEFKAQSGVAAVLSYFGIDAYCETVEYVVHRTGKKEDGTTIGNKGARFEPATQDLVNQAQPGDSYYFDDVKARCPGDKTARNLGSLTFKIR